MAMEPGSISNIIETYNALLCAKMINKENFNDSLYQIEYNNIRTQLLNADKNRGYTNWLSGAKKNIEIEDYRSEVY